MGCPARRQRHYAGVVIRSINFLLVLGLLAACAEQPAPPRTPEPALPEGPPVRIKDQVQAIVCSDKRGNLVEDLAPLVAYARDRDGSARRVWESADQAKCVNPPAA